MPKLMAQLEIDRCPHCSVDRPNLRMQHNFDTRDHSGQSKRTWGMYACGRCGGVVVASAPSLNIEITQIFPQPVAVETTIPDRARSYLDQALNSLHAPAGALMLAASSVDAMLKAKGYKDGNLYTRIDKAAADHLITSDMAKWAHEVRLDANDQRHADEAAPLPTKAGAERVINFTMALGQFLFVLPARVQRGLAESGKQ